MLWGSLVPAVVASGAAIGILTRLAPADAYCAAIVCASAALFFLPRRATMPLVLAVMGSLSAANGARARDGALFSPLEHWFNQKIPGGRADEAVQVRGTIVEDASASENGARLTVDVTAIRDGPTWTALTGRVQAHVSGAFVAARVADWTAGRHLEAAMVLRAPDVWLNPGGPSETWQRLHRSADLLGTVKSATLVGVAPGAWWDEWGAHLRRIVRSTAARYVAPHSAQSAAIVAAILIGDRTGLEDDVVRRLQRAGTYHVIAISGGNVALLAGLCALVARWAVRSPRVGLVATMAVVVVYGWLVGGGASVDRAVVAACVYLALALVGLAPDAIRVLGVVTILIVVVDPMTTVDVSAWLSFGASLGIILGASRFVRWARGWEPGPPRPRHWIGRVAWPAVLGLFGATLAAELTLAPVSAAVFSRVGIAGLVLNFAAIPAMAVVEVAGLVAVACGAWCRPAAALAGLVAHAAAAILVGSSSAIDLAPWASWRVPPTSIGWSVIYYGAGAMFVWRRDWRWPRVAAGLAALAALVVIVTAPGVEWARPPAGWVRVTMIDVGQGDAILVQCPTGHSLLIDAGGSSGAFDLGSRIVTPAVWASGVRQLDYLAFTHPDLDHIGGARSVARDLSPREIWEGVPVPPNAARRALFADAEANGIVWRELSAGHVITIGSLELDVVNPPLPDWERQRTRNEDSIVLRLRYGDVEMLLTGDAGEEFEGRVHAFDHLAALRLIKVGHHGSRSSSTEAFVAAYQPQIALMSVGRGNLFGHPAPEVVERYEDEGAEIFRTDRDGAVIVETDGRDLRLHTMRARTRTVMIR